jgi:hypothetical protein
LGHPVPPGDSAPHTVGLPRHRTATRTLARFPRSARAKPGRVDAGVMAARLAPRETGYHQGTALCAAGRPEH